MFTQFFQDIHQRGSGKRFAAITGFFAFTGMAGATGFGFVYSETLLLGGLTICAGLLGSTLFEKPKQNEKV